MESSPRTAASAVAYYKLFGLADWVDMIAMLVGGVAGLAHGAALPIYVLFLGKLIDAIGNFADTAQLSKQVSKYALYFVYLSLVRLGTGWLEVSMWMHTGDRQAARLRIRYVKALLSQDVGFFDTKMSTGEVVAGIASDTTLVQEAIGAKTGNLMHHMGQFVGGMVVSFVTLWQLSLLTLAVLPVTVMSAAFYAYVMVGITARNQRAYSRAAEVAHEVIAQVRTVHSFVGEKKAFRSYLDALQITKKLGIQGGLAKGLGIGALYGLGFGSFGLLLWFSGRLIEKGITNGGEAFTTILNVISSSLALGQAAPDIATISKAKVAGYTILEMIKRKPLISNNTDGLMLEQISGNIELQNVSFSYPSRPDIDIFQKFSLLIPAGKVVAIVGGSGAGKSTVISLIERFYDPTSGEVLLDGHDIKTMQLKWLRNQMSLVSQEPALFATSIRENIMCGKAGSVSLDDVVKAASVACANTFIDTLPKGYETQVGERGVQLSGGQKQRIAIARAMLRNPAILLLDEATSALDSDSEKSVQEALDRVMVGRTTVVVAHRLSTIRKADIIAVLQEGKVAELGSHEELMEKDGVYAALMKIQTDGPADSRTGRPVVDGHLSQHSLPQHSLSQRTFSFRSITDSLPAEGLTSKEFELNGVDVVGPRPSLVKLMRMNANEWPFGLLSATAAIVAGAQSPLFALIISQALVYFYLHDMGAMKRELQKVSLYCCGAGVLVALAYTCEFYFTGLAGERVTLRIRKAMFSAILQNEIGWFDLNSSTLLASRLAADAPLVKGAIVDRAITLLQNMGLIVTAFSITLSLQWRITWVMIVSFPALIIAYLGQMQLMKGFSGDIHTAYMRANMVAGEAVTNIRTVAAFSAEEKEGSVMGRPSLFCSVGVLWHYGFGISEAFAMAPDLLRSTKTLQGVFQILYRRTQIDVRDPSAEEVHAINGTIEFKNVYFSYPSRSEVPILTDFNLRVRRGYTQALVGASGSGKSSVIALICRFYDTQRGHVFIDGKDIKKLRLESLRRCIGLVQQEPALFSTSIYENIRYGKEGATEAEVVEAAKVANAHGFISGLPGGYKTEVGERGIQLSGGQKQRVAIARAVLKNPAILLLDEATSALDMESEKLVQEALNNMMQHRTTVLVAHRLSTVKNAHSIAVLGNGSIKEQGSHHELIAKEGAYFQLLNLSGSEDLEL
ncbi:hypothetical protein GOP47_0026856 [Adiantum capillus-veneris]|nr:hypothetical protein GOP47_0026856 [Adiantum capillus-veneris]